MTFHAWFKEQHVMPYLLVVVTGKEQEMRMIRIAEAVLVDTPGLVIWTSTATRLADQGPLAAIWCHMPANKRRAEMEPRSRFCHSLHEK